MSDLHASAEAFVSAYGAPESAVAVVQAYDALELEYGALRSGCGLMDWPQRGTVVVRGSERIAFLNRMLTQELKDVKVGEVRRAFWLNRKGRIDGDLRVIVLEDRVVMDVDVHAAARVVKTLGAYVITEDVVIQDVSEGMHRLGVHGPGAWGVLERVCGGAGERLEKDCAREVEIGGVKVLVDRSDVTGELGLELLVGAADVRGVYLRLLELAHVSGEEMVERAVGEMGVEIEKRATGKGIAQERGMLRPIGFAAYNIARIEAGVPMYLLDFGPDSLPGETGVLADRVSFKKGCYLGQEIVARMNALGHPKQRVVGVRIFEEGKGPKVEGDQVQIAENANIVSADVHDEGEAGARLTGQMDLSAGAVPRFPVTGEGLFAERGAADAAPVGAITSATLSPLLGRGAIALAMVQWGKSAGGTRLRVRLEAVRGENGGVIDEVMASAVVQEGLAFVPGRGREVARGGENRKAESGRNNGIDNKKNNSEHNTDKNDAAGGGSAAARVGDRKADGGGLGGGQ
ncbi:hypothetical protein BH11PLA1_BH11PLA1_20580 [soil metagenome]